MRKKTYLLEWADASTEAGKHHRSYIYAWNMLEALNRVAIHLINLGFSEPTFISLELEK